MSAYQIPNLKFSAEAAGTIARRRFVALNTTEKAIQAGDGAIVIGASENEATAGQTIEIYDGIVMVEAAAALNAGVEVQSDLNGKAIAKAAGAKAGVTITKAAIGELISVKM